MAYNSFPYTNYHELNLDYLLNKSKEIEGNVQETADNVLRATQQADRSTQQAVNSQNSATASAQSAAASSQSAVNSANSAAASAQSAEEARAAAGDPKTFTAAAQLTDTTKIYVYVGETGTYTYGHYYYYQGGTWHDGGVYGTWATDNALSDTSTNAVQNRVINAAVSELKSGLTGIITGEDMPFALNTTWAQGGVNRDGEYSSWSRIRTDYINVVGIDTITLIPVSGYAVYTVVYDGTQSPTRTATWSTQPVDIVLANDEEYIRASLRKEPEANLSPSAGVNLTATANYKITSDVNDVTQAVKVMNYATVEGLLWSIGGVSNGTDYASTTKIRTDYVDVTNYSRIKAEAPAGYKYNITFYDTAKTYLFTGPSAGYTTGSNIIELPDDIGYIRVTFSNDPDETVSDTSISSNFTLYANWEIVGKVKTLENAEVNLISGYTWTRGTFDANGEYLEGTSSVVMDNFLDVTEIKSIYVNRLTPFVGYYVNFYNDNGKIGRTAVLTESCNIVIPANTTKIKLWACNAPYVWIADATISNSIRVYKGRLYDEINDSNLLIDDYFCATSVNKKEIPALAAGTTILIYGDSITAAQDNTGWVYHFAQMTGCSIIDKAVGGSTFGHSATEDSGHWISTQIANTSDANWTSADMVIIAAGTNDYGHGTPLAEIKEYVQDAITTIRTKTQVPIVFITPIRRGLYVYDEPMKQLAMISGIISNVAFLNQCNVIKGFDIPLPTYNIVGLITDMTRDGLHPIATGANVYARSVVYALS